MKTEQRKKNWRAGAFLEYTRYAPLVRGPSTRWALQLIIVFIVPVSFSAQCLADDDRYKSDNQSLEVRSPVLESVQEFEGLQKIRLSEIKGVVSYAAKGVDQIKGLENRDALVIGKVDSVFIPSGNNKVILNFGRDFRNCFKAVIDQRDFQKWGTKDPKKIAKIFEGKNMAVDGLVSLYQDKPQIVVTLPHQLRMVAER